jgi:TetR/AcrR family transcriptional regulator, regulator of cefoperazone and chloramphenicol sensitivity
MRTPRLDGEESRERLLHAAVACFATHGFSKTTTRMIANQAGVNIAAISYYFGDKAGLYRAAYTEPMGHACDDIAQFDGQHLTLEQALQGLYRGFTEPLKQEALVQQCIRLHMREIVEPTGLWQEEIDQDIVPHHRALIQVLCRHYGLAQPDDDIYRLAFSIAALGVHMFVGRDISMKLHPHLMQGGAALDLMRERLVMYARAMVEAEGASRKSTPKKIAANQPVPHTHMKAA